MEPTPLDIDDIIASLLVVGGFLAIIGVITWQIVFGG